MVTEEGTHRDSYPLELDGGVNRDSTHDERDDSMTYDHSYPFEVVSDYEPAGDQPTAIQTLIEGVQAGLAHQTLLGVTGSVRPSLSLR